MAIIEPIKTPTQVKNITVVTTNAAPSLEPITELPIDGRAKTKVAIPLMSRTFFKINTILTTPSLINMIYYSISKMIDKYHAEKFFY
jgi:hypothetical protein